MSISNTDSNLENEYYTIAFYNLKNLFDTFDDVNTSALIFYQIQHVIGVKKGIKKSFEN
jgi:hypothetical protein